MPKYLYNFIFFSLKICLFVDLLCCVISLFLSIYVSCFFVYYLFIVIFTLWQWRFYFDFKPFFSFNNIIPIKIFISLFFSFYYFFFYILCITVFSVVLAFFLLFYAFFAFSFISLLILFLYAILVFSVHYLFYIK